MVYIQSDTERTLPNHFDCSCAMFGAIDSALKFRLTSIEEVISGKFDSLIKTNVFVGSVEFMTEVFNRVGITDVRLPMNSDRECEIITLKEAHERVSKGEKLFIKPVQIKLFTGLVLDGMKYSCLENKPDDTKVMAYKPFEKNILSEWRLYIHNGKITDSHIYSGDFKFNPHYEYIEKKIAQLSNRGFPIAYTIDVAILEGYYVKVNLNLVKTGYETVIVEFNDFFAIGNYGIPNDIYLNMLTDRYFEIIKNKK